MQTDIILAVLSNLIHITAFIIYNKDLLKGESNPNRASWGIWAFITILNFTSYGSMSGDWIKSLLPTISAILCIGTFFLTLFKGGKFVFNKWDVTALSLSIFASLVWISLQSATYANLILQIAVTIGFIPTVKSVVSKPENEKPLPWFLWSSAFIFAILLVILRWNNQWQDLVYPINALLWHFAVAVISCRKSN
jgi:hypothetical protein